MKRLVYVTGPAQTPLRLDKYLTEVVANMSRTQAQALIAAGCVKVQGKTVLKESLKLQPNQQIEVEIPYREEVKLTAEDIPLDILFENDALMVINKPPGLVVHPAFGHWSGTLANAVLHHLQQTGTEDLRPGIIHRLDKDTSGIMVVAKTPEAKADLQQQFARRDIRKDYLALVRGHLTPKEGIIEAPIGRDTRERKKMALRSSGKPSVTAYFVENYFEKKGRKFTLVNAHPLTGRTHQIRVHLESIGYPIVGDETYGIKDPDLTRHFLHAFRITFRLPGTQNNETFEAPLTQDLVAFLATLDKSDPS